jgi:inhibitor of KinA
LIALQQAFAENHFRGFIETVPAYSSLAVFYDAAQVRTENKVDNAFEFVKAVAEKLADELTGSGLIKRKQITVPVYYNGEDLEYVASQHGLSKKEVISIHTAKSYRVFMIGFLPGFAYMGTLDEGIATPRKSSPRVKVPAGAVGIAGFQTGIYPFESPGGWQLIGQTPLRVFDKQKDEPCLFKAGDEIKFIAVSKEEFEKLNEH